MNCLVLAYEQMPATMPNIAIKPLKHSAPEFMTLINFNHNYQDIVIESRIPNDLIYA